MDPVQLDGSALTCTDIAQVAAGRPVALTPAGRDRIVAAHRAALALDPDRPVYGRSTGVGANRSVVVPADRDQVLRLVRSHATSAGPRRGDDRIRALLAVRLNQLAAGGSGVSPAVADGLLGLLAADALPPVREGGSVGTGDLAALGTVALALAGEIPTTRPLPAVTELGPTDGLALLSSNAGALADAALAVVRLRDLARAGLDVAALSFVALRGNVEAVAAPVERATPFPGAVAVARQLRELLQGVGPAARIQDPFALRTLPQVCGPLVDALADAERVVAAMANAPSENPLILADDSVTHHGAFQATYLQMALDAVGLAVARAAGSGLARLGALCEPGLTGLPAFLAGGPPGSSGLMTCEYLAAAAVGELRALAVPAGLQTAVLSRGAEEDACFAALAARQALALAAPWGMVLATELVAAARALELGRTRVPPALADVLRRCFPVGTGSDDADLTDLLARTQELVAAWPVGAGPRTD